MTANTRGFDPGAGIASRASWTRGLFMLLFGFILSFLQVVVGTVAVLQFAFLLLAGQENEHLRGFGRGLASYAQAIVRFMTCDTEEKPFPFAPWPDGRSERQA